MTIFYTCDIMFFMKTNETLNLILTILFGVSLFFLIITFSIGLPIYCRFFYYAHINALNIDGSSGYSYAQIKEAYDQVINYLTLPNREFKTGVFAYSMEGKAHFSDVKNLVTLNVVILAVSATAVTTLSVLAKFKVITLTRPKGLFVGFYSAVGVLGACVIIFGLALINPSNAFVVFHKIFFPGKDNWMFDINTDQIITILPEQFFLNCGILIGGSIVIISAVIIALSVIMKKRREKLK